MSGEEKTKNKKLLTVIAVVLSLAAVAVITISILDPFHSNDKQDAAQTEAEPTGYQMSEKSKRLHDIYYAAYNHALGRELMKSDLVYDEAWLKDPDPSVVNAAEDGLADGAEFKEKEDKNREKQEKYDQYYRAAYNHAFGKDRMETPLTYDESWLNDPDETIAKAAKDGLGDGEMDRKMQEAVLGTQ